MLLYLDTPGLGLCARGGKLVIKTNSASAGSGRLSAEGGKESRAGNEVKTAYPPSGRLQCVIIAARGYVTIDALAWLAREHVALLVVWEGEFLTLTSATGGRLARGELAVRKRHFNISPVISKL